MPSEDVAILLVLHTSIRVIPFVGPPGIEPGPYEPESHVLPAYSGPTKFTTPKRAYYSQASRVTLDRIRTLYTARDPALLETLAIIQRLEKKHSSAEKMSA